jgi:hypothetical protein
MALIPDEDGTVDTNAIVREVGGRRHDVRRDVYAGRLAAVQNVPHSQWRIRLADAEAYVAERARRK